MEFRGAVHSIGYEGGGEGWLVSVQMREDDRALYTDAGDAIEEGLECIGIEYDGYEFTLTIEVCTDTERDAWLRWIIRYLAPQLGRDQELRAYIEFELY